MEPLQTISRVYWTIFFSICLCLHSSMFLLIYYRTSRTIRNLRWFLYPSNTASFVLATVAFILQVRNVNNKISMALLCDGICKFIGPWFCYHCYNLLLTMITVTGLINLHTLCYRTMCLKHFETRKSNRASLKFSLHYLIPMTPLILTYFAPINHADVYMETLNLHPNYNFEPYKNFGGFANSHHFCMNFNTAIYAFNTIYFPIIGNYWKRIAMKILKSSISTASSKSTRVMSELLVKGLNLQVLLPLICYVPISILFCWNKYSGQQIEISQYSIAFFGTLPCFFDPLLQIYFILPYRSAVRRLIFCGCSAQTSVANSSPNRGTILSV
ncbi:Serpentine Receptor, class D (Delta) [Caenorhabditis elegans]|uniref:Serpentine Receptor, class D (Delta) n=1 Tax=Caenorhabditis elegans TaxID=6239 RepID=G5EFQ7_CAEEL|nr:Serpentine Receptor, class D (Delta) [Caenorhabditis elegans]NP_503685.1 Serpentine Receptor, class D (Delta) [Caenorhabditis elegans]CCD62288.1 Serpentine Receptor, class D (Delta) [Caenorhabditis elegans]CCD64371.1 Serpentine Receptor, class D (Delta) [Caenorhabditis elegans]|eukprot:NP_001024221.1 Serpentine Receptor, class D (delta) [Caenorhabditis elegans]